MFPQKTLKKINKWIILAGLALLPPLSLYGTVFFPQSMKNQMDESYGLIHGKFRGKIYKVLDSTGQVVTVASLDVIKSAGLKRNEMLNHSVFQVMYPGGVWQGIVYSFQGVPQFYPNEEVVLLLNKNHEGFWVQNLSMGKYRVVYDKGNPYLESSVFPNHPKFGKIPWSEFEDLVVDRFGESLLNKKTDKVVVIPTEILEKRKEQNRLTLRGKGRVPAKAAFPPKNGDESDSDRNQEETYWPVLLLGLLGGISTLGLKLTRRKK